MSILPEPWWFIGILSTNFTEYFKQQIINTSSSNMQGIEKPQMPQKHRGRPPKKSNDNEPNLRKIPKNNDVDSVVILDDDLSQSRINEKQCNGVNKKIESIHNNINKDTTNVKKSQITQDYEKMKKLLSSQLSVIQELCKRVKILEEKMENVTTFKCPKELKNISNKIIETNVNKISQNEEKMVDIFDLNEENNENKNNNK